MNYRCLKCGGKMQYGGQKRFSADENGECKDTMGNIVDCETGNKLYISPSLNPSINTSLALNGPVAGRSISTNSKPVTSPKPSPNSSNIYDPVYLRQGIAGLSEISGRVERNRQDQYDMQQQQLLGLMNAMPVSNFQPNPYSLYAKYGGKIKDHLYVGPAFSNDAEMRMDKYREKKQMGGPMQRDQPSYSIYKSSGKPITAKDSADYRNFYYSMLARDPKTLSIYDEFLYNREAIPERDIPPKMVPLRGKAGIERKIDIYDSVMNQFSAYDDGFDKYPIFFDTLKKPKTKTVIRNGKKVTVDL